MIAVCPGMNRETGQPPGRGASPSEGGQGDEWAAYVALARTAKTYRGMAYGARALWPRSAR